MSDPAELTLTEVAAAIRRRKVSSVEVTQALLARIEHWQPTLNAFVRVEAEDALAAAKAADRALARREAEGPAAWRAARPQGHVLLGGQARRLRLEDPRGLDRAGDRRPRSRGSRPPARSGSARCTWPSSPTGRPGTTSTSRASVCNPWDPSRITGGSSSGSGAAVGGAARPCGARLRHRRLDPAAGAFLRRDRLQADQRPRQPRQRDAALVHARHRRAAGADRGGLRD